MTKHKWKIKQPNLNLDKNQRLIIKAAECLTVEKSRKKNHWFNDKSKKAIKKTQEARKKYKLRSYQGLRGK